MIDPALALVILIVGVALVFDFFNGFHDAANSIATVVSTRVLRPGLAVVWAAFFNFVAAFVFPLKVATTIGKGLVVPAAATQVVILAGLAGAIFWDIVTWYFGLPTSSSHALIGGYAGAAIAKVGWNAIIYRGWTKTVVSMFASPVIGLILGLLLMTAVIWLFRDLVPRRIDKYFRRLQLLSAGLYSLGHGGNDAQKTMGIIAVLIYTYKRSLGQAPADIQVTLWMVLACHAAIALGTLSGGWRIVKTMGSKITKLKPVGGFCAETAAALTLFGNSYLGIPVSTTHTITGGIMGVGATQRLSAVRWGVATRIVWAWVLTIPCSAIVAALCYHAIALFAKV
ncbi:MAG TPA: inorganic phosphate transporter [Thermoanaerobaculaceae bacterium]|nr:inorganic phosphate transporter [Thermoanaerobaculaceae bacterium]